MPLQRYMRKHDCNLLRHYALGGALIGVIPTVILLAMGLPKLSIGMLVPILSGVLVGAFSATLFWVTGFIARETGRSPNRCRHLLPHAARPVLSCMSPAARSLSSILWEYGSIFLCEDRRELFSARSFTRP